MSVCAHADRDIVFSAQLYKWSKHIYHDEYNKPKGERTLDNVGPYQLFRMNPDGSGLTRLTFGKLDCLFPKWSPDGKRIAFFRQQYNETWRLCICDSGGKNRVAYLGFVLSEYRRKILWSPDSSHIGILNVFPSESIEGIDTLTIIDIKNGTYRRIQNVTDFDWSPDGKQIATWFLSHDLSDHELCAFKVVNAYTGKTTSKTIRAAEPIWISPNSILALPKVEGVGNKGNEVIIVSNTGRVLGTHNLRSIRNPKVDGEYDGPFTMTIGQRSVVPHSTSVVFESFTHVSDGPHYWCDLVDWLKFTTRQISTGMCLGISPDGKSTLIADQNWLGPYKRGGRRCGPIKIFDLKTGKSRKLTGNLMSVEGGDWRHVPNPQK